MATEDVCTGQIPRNRPIVQLRDMAKHCNFRTGELLLICAVIIVSVTSTDKRMTDKRKFDFMYYLDDFLKAEAMNSDSSINRCVI